MVLAVVVVARVTDWFDRVESLRAHVLGAVLQVANWVFLAGDGSLALMSRTLRAHGFRTYRSHIHANVGCTLDAAAP